MTKRAAGDLPPEPACYINVDLDVYAGMPLDGFVQGLGEDAFVLYVGGERRKYEAHVELAASHNMSADDTIVRLIDLVRGLPRVHRKVWDSAHRREFNIGIQAGIEPHAFELRLQQQTLKAIAGVRAVLVITVYAPDLRESPRPVMARRRKVATR